MRNYKYATPAPSDNLDRSVTRDELRQIEGGNALATSQLVSSNGLEIGLSPVIEQTLAMQYTLRKYGWT